MIYLGDKGKQNKERAVIQRPGESDVKVTNVFINLKRKERKNKIWRPHEAKWKKDVKKIKYIVIRNILKNKPAGSNTKWWNWLSFFFINVLVNPVPGRIPRIILDNSCWADENQITILCKHITYKSNRKMFVSIQWYLKKIF